MKKLQWMVTCKALLLVMLVLGACSQGGGGTASDGGAAGTPSKTPGTETVTIKIFNIKVEIADALAKMKQEYEQAHPGVKLEIDSQISDQYSSSLKARFTSGEMPDLFNIGGFREMALWSEHLEDLSSEPWISDVVETALPGAVVDGKVYGFPTAIEGVGYTYNKDLFEKAGITKVPVTLTEMKEAVEKLRAANITPFIVPYGSWFSPGVFTFDNPMAKQEDPDQFFADLTSGAAKFADNPLFGDLMEAVNLELDNAYGDPMTVDYNTQVSAFATGEGAMTVGCNCTQPLYDQVNPDLNIGMMPMPLNDDAALNDNMFVSVPYYWVMSKDSKVKEETKQFLNWLATDGAHYISDEFQFVPPFKSMDADPEKLGPLGADVKRYVDENKVLTRTTQKWPEGAMLEFGSTLQKYAYKKIDEAQAIEEFQTVWDKLSKK